MNPGESWSVSLDGISKRQERKKIRGRPRTSFVSRRGKKQGKTFLKYSVFEQLKRW